MAAIGMVQMLIEAAEFLERRERGKVFYVVYQDLLHMWKKQPAAPPPPISLKSHSIYALVILKPA